MSPLPKNIALLTGLAMTLSGAAAQEARPHNVILFVPDGLRALSVTPASAPTMAAIRDRGVNFQYSHSMFPTGNPAGIPLSQAVKDKLAAAGLPLVAPGRGDNGKTGDFKTPGTTSPNTVQQGYFADVASKVVLPMLKARNKPFVLVFWSRDPD